MISYPESLTAFLRVVFGCIFVLKIWSSLRAYEINWAHQRPGGDKGLQALLICLILFSLCFTLGILVRPSLILAFLLYVFLYRHASIYGMEDTFCQIFMLFLFLSPGSSQFALWSKVIPQSGSFLAELSLLTAVGIILFSAGVNKCQSRIWRNGTAVYYFFLLPLHRRWDSSIFLHSRIFLKLATYGVLVLQLGALPAFLLNGFPLGVLFSLAILAFAITLSTLFVFTWLGEIITLCAIVAILFLQGPGAEGLLTLWIGEFKNFSPLTLVVALSLLAGLWSSLVRHLAPSLLKSKIHGIIHSISRYTWGLGPVELFNEKHMQGPVAYRVFLEGEERLEVFKMFSEQGMAGKERFFQPTFVEVTQYKISEICMELDTYGQVKSLSRQVFLKGFLDYVDRLYGLGTKRLVFQTRQFEPPAQFKGAAMDCFPEQWKDAFSVERSAQGELETKRLCQPILFRPTGRDIERLSFSFDPKV